METRWGIDWKELRQQMASNIFSPSSSVDLEDNTDLMNQIDELVPNVQDVAEVIDFLAGITISAKPWNEGGANALRGDLEGQFWPWNRAAGELIRNNRPKDALEVWSAMYIAFLALQAKNYQRYHKGMALCNVGYAFGKIASKREMQAKCWLLGIIEDVLTNPETADAQLNFRNAAKSGISETILRQFARTIETRFVEEAIVPAFPETCVEFWQDPTWQVPSDHCLRNVTRLHQLIQESSPQMPQVESYADLLEQIWSFADWSKGVVRGE
jgi:hypothetical protein